MNATFQSGDIRKTYVGGHTRYVRVGGPNPDGSPTIYVHPCDGFGFLIGNSGRYLKAETLATRYEHHARPIERYGR